MVLGYTISVWGLGWGIGFSEFSVGHADCDDTRHVATETIGFRISSLGLRLLASGRFEGSEFWFLTSEVQALK